MNGTSGGHGSQCRAIQLSNTSGCRRAKQTPRPGKQLNNRTQQRHQSRAAPVGALTSTIVPFFR